MIGRRSIDRSPPYLNRRIQTVLIPSVLKLYAERQAEIGQEHRALGMIGGSSVDGGLSGGDPSVQVGFGAASLEPSS
ncbi:hypothetical protein CcI49_30110 [Frankia sp. CcI49]|nr:hypothetical protein CcI49_30110 [Frankia sp. CcI49]